MLWIEGGYNYDYNNRDKKKMAEKNRHKITIIMIEKSGEIMQKS